MKRLTTDNPSGNFETMLNFVYGKDGWAHIRHDGKNDADVMLTSWAKAQCVVNGCENLAETPVEIDQALCDRMMDCPGCPIALAYCFASQAVHMRSRLKMYEDILFAEDGTERVSLDDLRELIKARDNPPLTLEELREMDGEPVWVVSPKNKFLPCWMLINLPKGRAYDSNDEYCLFREYGKTWLAYRGKLEEGTT